MPNTVRKGAASAYVEVTEEDGRSYRAPAFVLLDPASGEPYASGGSSTAFRSVVSITRPANATAYAAGDVIGGVLTLPAIGPTAGHVLLTSLDLRYDVAALPSGMAALRLHLYSATPPSALADNAPWDLPAGDRAAYIGFVELPALTDLGSTLFSQLDQVNKQIQLAAAQTGLFGYLVTVAGFPPAGNSETLRLVARAVGL